MKVPKHKRRVKGKWVDVETYDRKKRPKSKKRIINKKLKLVSPGQKKVRVLDGNGRFIGWKLDKWKEYYC